MGLALVEVKASQTAQNLLDVLREVRCLRSPSLSSHEMECECL